jgi:hypothetical protein
MKNAAVKLSGRNRSIYANHTSAQNQVLNLYMECTSWSPRSRLKRLRGRSLLNCFTYVTGGKLHDMQDARGPVGV